jgi:predicted CopG family antitoxin
MPNYTLDNPLVNKVKREKTSRSPIRELFEAGRLTDLLEFLTNYYDGMGTEEALDILRRIRRA